jgi:hypothetical protein
MATNSANCTAAAPAEAHAIHTLRTCLLDPTHGARRVLALTDALIALQRDSIPR